MASLEPSHNKQCVETAEGKGGAVQKANQLSSSGVRGIRVKKRSSSVDGGVGDIPESTILAIPSNNSGL